MRDLTIRLENKVGEVYRYAPELPGRIKAWLLQWLPWGTLLAAFASLLGADILWQFSHHSSTLMGSERRMPIPVHKPLIVLHGIDVALWLSLGLLFADAALYLLAFRGLHRRKKAGWNNLFYAILLNLPYGASTALTSIGSIGSLGSATISTAIGLYVLFQLRSYYTV